jgi:hypothetical protein
MDVYTQQGNIIREHPNPDATTAIELEFLSVPVMWTRLYSVAIYYLALHDRLGIDYVVGNAMCTRAVVRKADLDARAREVLIATLLDVRAHSNELLGAARDTLFDKPPSGVLDINHLPELAPYEQNVLDCKAFVERLVTLMPAPPRA